MLSSMSWIGLVTRLTRSTSLIQTAEKGFVWFTVQESTVLASTGMKAVKVKILDEGVVPAWMDLTALQVWAAGVPLGSLNEGIADDGSLVTVNRVLEKDETTRKVTVSTEACKIVFQDPKNMSKDESTDLGWAIRDALYKGCQLRTSNRPGKWALDVGHDEGNVINRAAAPNLVTENVKEYKYWGFP